ncbi:MAG TPA: hypothetical protein VFF82_06550 [Rhodocyclaceae bacterium]|nr:hypothetical protein [Rhodocyclaceae bacterium]
MANQGELDILVVHMELTLIAIVQGVALTILVEHSYEVLVELRFLYWPYVLAGLTTILIFWSRSSVHSLTVIRWPLDLTHNCMYIACTLIEAAAFTQLANPLHWYALNTLFAVTVTVLFALDLRMIRQRIGECPGPAGSQLFALLEKEQFLNMRWLMPATAAFNLAAALAITTWPAALIEQGGHAIIGLIQLAAAMAYLVYGARFFGRAIPLVAAVRTEWHNDGKSL